MVSIHLLKNLAKMFGLIINFFSLISQLLQLPNSVVDSRIQRVFGGDLDFDIVVVIGKLVEMVTDIAHQVLHHFLSGNLFCLPLLLGELLQVEILFVALNIQWKITLNSLLRIYF